MSRLSLLLVPLVLALAMLARPAVADVLRVDKLEFKHILIYDDIDVEISQGEEALLLLRGNSDKLDRQPFFISDDTLVLGRSREYRREDFSGVKFKLTVRELEHLQLKGSGNVYVKPIKADELYISVAGSGDARLFAIDGNEVVLQLSGSGDIKVAKAVARELRVLVSGSGDLDFGSIETEILAASLKGSGDIGLKKPGQALDVQLNIVGSGDIDFASLDSSSATVNIIGSGDAQLGVSKALEVHIMGSGDVYYRGEPQLDQKILGSGEARRRP